MNTSNALVSRETIAVLGLLTAVSHPRGVATNGLKLKSDRKFRNSIIKAGTYNVNSFGDRRKKIELMEFFHQSIQDLLREGIQGNKVWDELTR